MASLASTYSNALGLQLGEMYIRKQFYPLEFDKYITVQAFSGNQPSKNYDHWNEILSILAPVFEQNGIKIVQIGAKDEPPLPGCVHLMGKTNWPQASYILSNSILHLGADSFGQHVAGALGIPLVVLFGSTDKFCHGAHWKKAHSFIESHRWGRLPSYGPENEKTINLIPVEEVTNSIFKILGASIQLNRKSLLIGHRFNQPMLEWVPDAILHADFSKGSVPLARFDLGGSEEVLFQTLQGRKLNILTNRPINPNGLAQLRSNIDILTIEFTHNSYIDIPYLKALKSIGIKLQCFTLDLDGEELSKKRLEFFDHCQIIKVNHKTRDNFISDSRRYLNDPHFNLEIKPSTWFKSNKFLLARGKVYLSKFHYLADLPTEDFSKNVSQVPDHEEFWREQDYFYIFEQQI
jgi:hypothetical protein